MFSSAFFLPPQIVKRLQFILPPNTTCFGGFFRKNGASGDTELFEKASNINGFQGGQVANNLYISPFRATVFQTAALFLYPNSSVVIRVRKPLFFPL